MQATDGKGQVVFTKTLCVKASGGTTYGELPIVQGSAGYTTMRAELLRGSQSVVTDNAKLFAVRLNMAGLPATGMVAATSGVLAGYLKSVGVTSFRECNRAGRRATTCW